MLTQQNLKYTMTKYREKLKNHIDLGRVMMDFQTTAQCLLGKFSYNIFMMGINTETVLWWEDHNDHPLCPGLQPGPPSQTPGGLGQRY